MLASASADTFSELYFEPSYSLSNKTFSSPAAIRGRNGNNIAGTGLALGLPLGIFVIDQADMKRRRRPYHAGSIAGWSSDTDGVCERFHLSAYIHDVRSSMEGENGGKSEGQ